MKKILVFLIAILVVVIAVPIGATAFAAGEMKTDYPSRSAYLIDFDTGKVLLDRNSEDRYPIASMVKIMTLLKTFDEIDKGNLTLDEKILISETAAGMGGSQMFLDAGKEYPITDLIKGVTVCSANDAAVALGERISGNIDQFVEEMNRYAKEIAMENTLFCNATGLPGSGEQYSTAKDVTTMFKNLLTKEKYFDYSTIWMENYTHPDGRVTEMVNTNKLIRFYKNCDAGKTGFTNDALFCLAASAKKDGMRIVGAVLGSETSKDRFREMTDMFNYAFAKYEVRTLFQKGDVIPNDVKVAKSKNDKIDLYVDSDVKYFTEKGNQSGFRVEVVFPYALTAPLSKGETVGEIVVKNDNGEIITKTDVKCATDVEKRGYGDAINDVTEKWLLG